MTWVVPLALGGFAILLMATFTMLSARRRHQAHVAPATVVGPRVLIHDINDDRCTGCDACVAVCPTNVLDLVANKSRVLRFQDCIQCEACMFACPTEALVMFPEGGLPPPLMIPEIDENFQTAVPGQYLIGEVAGKPLVKSAANLGRAVIEHMFRVGIRPGALGRGHGFFDVAIVGSGPGGLSAALACIARGLTYVVLEKEQLIASTIARYPKGKLVMAEPYDTQNLSFLPVFDSSKENLIPIWEELIDRVGLAINRGESVEQVVKAGDNFELRTTVATYRAQRVVLSIGTRGKPRTLQVPGENLPKIFSLLDDPDDWRGKNVLVVGGGDSACEAALALADAGARVTISYRGKGFNRAAPKNKSAIEAYAAEARIKAKLGSQVLEFDRESVVLALADGSQKRYPNDGAFVLIGADPPVAWLEKMGIQFVQRPHQHQMGKTDDILRRFIPRPVECPQDAARAAAQILGGSTGHEPRRRAPVVPIPVAAPHLPLGEPEVVSGPRKWLRSATSIFSINKDKSGSGIHHHIPPRRATSPAAGAPGLPPPLPKVTKLPTVASGGGGGAKRKFEQPVPLSEFARRGKSPVTETGTNVRAGTHSGHGRRDSLTAGERTRILRMLRDEGGRLADEDSQVFVGAPPAPKYDFDFDDDAPVAPPPPSPVSLRPDVPAKPAVVVGIDKARRQKRPSGQPGGGNNVVIPSSPTAATRGPQRLGGTNASAHAQAAAQARARAPLPKPFDEPTRAVHDAEMIAKVRDGAHSGAGPAANSASASASATFDELPTRLGLDPALFDEPAIDDGLSTIINDAPHGQGPKFLNAATVLDPVAGNVNGDDDDSTHDSNNEATRLAHVDSIQPPPSRRAGGAGPTQPARPAARAGLPKPGTRPPANGPNAHGPNAHGVGRAGADDRTRSVDIRSDGSMSDVDWDID